MDQAGLGNKMAHWMGKGMVFILLWFAFLKLPLLSSAEPMPSWESVLAYAFQQKWQWGVEVVFTYGPLGFITADAYWGWHLGLMLAWAGGAAALFSVLILPVLQRLPAINRIIFCALVPWLTVPRNADLGTDAVYLFFLCVVGVGLVHESKLRWWRCFLAAVLAVVGLIKFTFFLLGMMILVVGLITWWWRRDRRAAGEMLLSYLLVLVVVWQLAGQALANFPTWLVRSWQITVGYPPGMAVEPFDHVVLPAVMMGVGLLVWYALVARPGGTARAPWPAVLILGGGTFLAWKEGFVRADEHVAVFFTFGCLLALTLPGLPGLPEVMAGRPARAWGGWAATALVLLAALTGFSMRGGTFLIAAKAGMIPRLRDTALAICHPYQFCDRLETRLAERRREAALPRIADLTGHAPMDVLNCDQDRAILNQLNYRPRPIFQSYSAYSPELQAVNAGFYEATNPPAFVLWRSGSMDRHFPNLEDGKIIVDLLARYVPVARENNFVLWQLRTTNIVAGLPVERTFEVGAGEWFQVAAEAPWVQLDVRPNWTGHLREIAYQAKVPEIEVKLAGGEVRRYCLPIGFAKSGFLLTPMIDSLGTTGNWPVRVDSAVTVVAARICPDTNFYQSGIKIQFSQVVANATNPAITATALAGKMNGQGAWGL